LEALNVRDSVLCGKREALGECRRDGGRGASNSGEINFALEDILPELTSGFYVLVAGIPCH